MDGPTETSTGVLMNRWIYGVTGYWMDQWMHGRMDKCITDGVRVNDLAKGRWH